MKFVKYIIAIFLFSGSACSNDILVDMEGGEDLPVIYSILDMNSDIQYVRIAKTYHGNKYYKDQVPPSDSLKLPGFKQIYIEEWDKEELLEIYYFEHCEGIIKDTGLFPIEAIAVYQSDFKPKNEFKYILYTFFPQRDIIISGETKTIGKTKLLDPLPLFVREVNFRPGRNYTLRWESATNAGIYQGILRINYIEESYSGISFKSYDMKLPINYTLEQNLVISQEISSGSFFRSLTDNIPIKKNVSRELLSMDFTLYSAGEDLAYFIKAQAPTFWMNLSQYTNLDNGFGIFSSSSLCRVDNIQFSDFTRYHIATDSLTSLLNFKDPYK